MLNENNMRESENKPYTENQSKNFTRVLPQSYTRIYYYKKVNEMNNPHYIQA